MHTTKSKVLSQESIAVDGMIGKFDDHRSGHRGIVELCSRRSVPPLSEPVSEKSMDFKRAALRAAGPARYG